MDLIQSTQNSLQALDFVCVLAAEILVGRYIVDPQHVKQEDFLNIGPCAKLNPDFTISKTIISALTNADLVTQLVMKNVRSHATVSPRISGPDISAAIGQVKNVFISIVSPDSGCLLEQYQWEFRYIVNENMGDDAIDASAADAPPAGDFAEIFRRTRELCTNLSPLKSRHPNKICLRIDFEWVQDACKPATSPLFIPRSIPTPSNEDQRIENGSSVLGSIEVKFYVIICEAGGSIMVSNNASSTGDSPQSDLELMPPPPPRAPKTKRSVQMPEDSKTRRHLKKFALQLWLTTLEWANLDDSRLNVSCLRNYLGQRVPKNVSNALFKRLIDTGVVEIEDGLRYIAPGRLTAEINATKSLLNPLDTITEEEEEEEEGVILIAGAQEAAKHQQQETSSRIDPKMLEIVSNTSQLSS